MKNSFTLYFRKYFLPVILVALIITSCGKSAESEKPGEEQADAGGNQSTVQLTRKQYDEIKIQLGSITQKNLTNVLKTTGFLKVPPQNKASITSALGGTVQSILVQEGDFVQKGQTVATVTNPEFVRMQQEFLETQAQMTFAEQEYNRQKELSAQNVSAQKIFQQAQSNFNSLQAKFNSLKQQLALLNINTSQLLFSNISSSINIKSPISGSISHIEINIGSNIQPSNSLMDVVDNSQLHLDLFVFEQDLTTIKVGQTVDFTLTNLAGKSYTAKIFSVGNAFENDTKTISVHATITGDKTGLIEGMNVTGLVDIGDNLSPAIPSTALMSSGGSDFIFVLADGTDTTKEIHFEKVQVKKGISEGGFTAITPLRELSADIKVVISGSYYLMAILTNSGEEE
ncbi:MAG: efflux RND transporter periplasmic adaptor subunit [Bacteroidia bacterium]